MMRVNVARCVMPNEFHPDFESTCTDLLTFLQQYSVDRNARFVGQLSFDEWWDHLIANGWSRNALYWLIRRIWTTLSPESPEYVTDLLEGEETGLTGFCHVDCITRLKGEPGESEAFLNYVYGREWLSDGK